MDRTYSHLIYLCGCGVNGIKPDEQKVREMDLESLYKTARFHSLTAITAIALESAGVQDREFRQAKEKAIRKNMLLDLEREKLCGYLEENKIWYMPLKGSILKDFYPKYGMRQMADNDILFDSHYRKTVKEYFESNHYEVVSYDKSNHDVYEKPPILNFEMHTSLFCEAHDEKWQAYYEDIKTRLEKDDDNSYGYHFSDEDFYIYITTHEYKHYSGNGTGLRSLLDCYVYLQKKSASLDWHYIEAECEKLGISGFEKQRRGLAVKTFAVSANSEISETDRRMLAYYFSSGTYGTLEHAVKVRRKKYADKTGKTSRLSYIMYRLFPNKEWYEACYPFYNRHPYFKPFFVIYRLFRRVFFGKKAILSELRVVRKSKQP